MEVIKRILIADTSEEFRQNFIEGLSGEQDIHVVGQTADGRELLELAEKEAPDAIVMDLVLTSLDGLDRKSVV